MTPAGADEPLRFAHFELDPAERVLRVRGAPVPVGSRAFDLLLALAQRHERLVTKQELLDLVWPGLVVEEHNIATQVGNLRKLLGSGAIATLPGYGYRLTAVRLGPRAAAAPAAPQPPTARPTHNLPDPRTRFIGREAALADLQRLLPTARLLTLTGIGGSGKTRLALRFAQQQAAAFADGVWFVDLSALPEGTRVAATCAAALGLATQGERAPLDGLREHLAARRALLVLDNCEQVRAAAAALAEALLAAAPDLVIVATSREALGLAGEQIYPVRSLALPATDDPAAVAAAESTRVFVDRARLLQPDFDVDADNAAALAEICRRLDGIALALELAAARVTTLSVAQIARRLDDRFRLLTGGQRSVPRHQTLQAAMQWSYEQLNAAEQRMLRALSVFAGGCTLQAAADVAQTADEYEALAQLTALHDKSLLVVEPRAPGGRARYGLLETVRQYALERLQDCGEAGAVRGRHVAHFVAMAEEADAHIRSPEQDRWMARFKEEHENLVAALAWCGDGAPDDPATVQAGLRLAAASGYYWGWNSVDLGHRLTRAVLQRDRSATDTPARAGTLCALTRMSEFRGRYEEALEYAQEALAVARRLGEPRALAWALSALGSALGALGRHAPALQAKQEGLALARQLGDGAMLFTLHNNIGSLMHQLGRLDEAERCYREGLEWARGHAGRVGTVVVLDNLIRVLVARGALDEARRSAIECLPLARGEKVAVDLLEACVGLASRLGQHALAARFWGASDRQLQAWGYRHEPGEIEHLAPLLEASRRALGEVAFHAAEAAGRAVAFDPVLAELEAWLDGLDGIGGLGGLPR